LGVPDAVHFFHGWRIIPDSFLLFLDFLTMKMTSTPFYSILECLILGGGMSDLAILQVIYILDFCWLVPRFLNNFVDNLEFERTFGEVDNYSQITRTCFYNIRRS